MIFNDVLLKYANHQNNKTLKLSSGEKDNGMVFQQNWEITWFKCIMNIELWIAYSPISLKQSILFNQHQIISHLKKNASKSTILIARFFFNITNGEIYSELIKNLKFGKKFTLKTKSSSNVKMKKSFFKKMYTNNPNFSKIV